MTFIGQENVTFVKKNKSYPVRALTRKTISYQKRQIFVNVCCIALCPFMMVAIAGILAILIGNLVNNAHPSEGNYIKRLFDINLIKQKEKLF